MFNVEDVGILIYLILIIHAIFCKHTDKKVSVYHLRNERGFDYFQMIVSICFFILWMNILVMVRIWSITSVYTNFMRF